MASSDTFHIPLWWLSVIETYLAQHERGIPALAVRYDDLNAHREGVVAEIFRYCGLPADRVQEALGAFARDSQAGTELGRDNPHAGNLLMLSDDQRSDIVSILERHPVVKDSDFVVPGTLSL